MSASEIFAWVTIGFILGVFSMWFILSVKGDEPAPPKKKRKPVAKRPKIESPAIVGDK